LTPPASGLPSATLPAEVRATLALRADPAAGRFAGASSIAALLFLLERAREGDDDAARLALAVLRRTPGDGLPPAAAAAEAAVHVEAVELKRDDGLERTARGAVDAALAAFGWNSKNDEGDDRERSAIHSPRDREGDPSDERRRIHFVAAEDARGGLGGAPLARPRPIDDAGTDAHGLMIATLARASLTFDAPGYREAAARAGARALDHRVDAKTGALLHLGGESERAGGLGDYALLVRGLLELLPATGEKGWLHEAVRLQGEQEERLWDVGEGGYFESPEDAGGTVRKHGSDGSFLSGNGVSTLNLIDLSRLTGERSYRDRAEGVLRAFAVEIAKEPLAHLTLLRAAQRFARTSYAA
jgi:hypothetical protein